MGIIQVMCGGVFLAPKLWWSKVRDVE